MTKITSLGRRTRFTPSSGQTRNHWRRTRVRCLRLEPLEQRALLDALGPLGSNFPPVAADNEYTAFEGAELRIPAVEGVLVNDSDPDGDSLSALLDIGPEHGTLVLDLDGSFTYTPDADFTGQDAFTYRASDGELESGAATVTIDVVVPAEIRGMVWEDSNGDGLRDPGEPPLQSWVVYADYDSDGQLNALEPSAVSGPDGAYALAVSSGSFTIAPVDQIRWTEAAPQAVSPAPGEIVEGIDFGNQTNVQRTGLLPLGGEFRVNAHTDGDQSNAAVAVDDAGNYVVVWESEVQDGDYGGIYAQRYDASGVAAGSEFRVNTSTDGAQGSPAVAMDPAGDFVVAWQSWGDNGYGIYAQRFDAAGMPQGVDFRVSAYTSGNQMYAAVAMDTLGGFVVAWQGDGVDGSGSAVVAQRYDPLGVPQGVQIVVNTFKSGDQHHPTVAVDPDGNFVVVWQSENQDADRAGIYAQRYSAAGEPQGDEFRVNTETAGDLQNPTVGIDADGNFAVTWESISEGGTGYDVFLQRYDAAGASQGGQTRVNTFTAQDQRHPAVAVDATGGLVVGWEGTGPHGQGKSVFAQRYDAAGRPVGAEFRVNSSTAGRQGGAAVGMNSQGGCVLAWQAKTRTATATPLSPNGSQRFLLPRRWPATCGRIWTRTASKIPASRGMRGYG